MVLEEDCNFRARTVVNVSFCTLQTFGGLKSSKNNHMQVWFFLNSPMLSTINK